MANWGNQHTQQVQAETIDKHESGIDDGSAFIGYPMPAFFTKAVKMLTAYERGFIFGHWLKLWLDDSKE
jgi:hypothetical protein